jgi:hypothetical protein
VQCATSSAVAPGAPARRTGIAPGSIFLSFAHAASFSRTTFHPAWSDLPISREDPLIRASTRVRDAHPTAASYRPKSARQSRELAAVRQSRVRPYLPARITNALTEILLGRLLFIR